MRFSLLIFSAPLFFSLSGCALVLGLDSGNDVADFADAEAGAEEAASDAGITPPGKDSGPTCAPDTADCNGNSNDGCETSLATPQHCGSCTTMCTPMQSCAGSSHCCTNDNLICNVDQDCCSGKCNGHKCGH